MTGTKVVTEAFGQRRGGRWTLIIFVTLQCLDLLTTVVVFSRGGFELNPVVRSLMPLMGPFFAVVVCKALLISLILVFSRRPWMLRFANVLYTGIVAWNVLILLALK
jgi:hypothetical protein